MLPGIGFSGSSRHHRKTLEGQNKVSNTYHLWLQLLLWPMRWGSFRPCTPIRIGKKVSVDILEGIGTWVVGEKGRGINQKKMA